MVYNSSDWGMGESDSTTIHDNTLQNDVVKAGVEDYDTKDVSEEDLFHDDQEVALLPLHNQVRQPTIKSACYDPSFYISFCFRASM